MPYSVQKVPFSDECASYHRPSDRNAVFWSKEKPRVSQQLEHNPLHVLIRAGTKSRYLIGPYFFDGPVNTASNVAMLETWFKPQLKDTRVPMDDVWLQHNEANPPFVLSLRDVLQEHFASR